jgi:hypothetical protein
MKKILKKLAMSIINRPIAQIYLLRKTIIIVSLFIIGIPYIIWIITNSGLSKAIFFAISALVLILEYFILLFINVNLTSILIEQIDLDKWEKIPQYVYSKKKNKSNLSVLLISYARVDYYRGNFEKSIEEGLKADLSTIKRNKMALSFLNWAYLYKSSLMLDKTADLEELKAKMRGVPFKGNTLINWSNNLLNFYQIIEDIVVNKKPNDAINDWQPQYPGGKLAILEKTYFKALNEQLKGNDEKVRELFEQLSQENPDLFFVKEAKKYLETDLNILPLGSVVTVKGNDVQLVIISRGTLTKQNDIEGYFDYGAVLAPAGLVSADNVLMFNREDIDKIIFIGYVDSDEQDFEQEYDNLISKQNYPKLKV